MCTTMYSTITISCFFYQIIIYNFTIIIQKRDEKYVFTIFAIVVQFLES